MLPLMTLPSSSRQDTLVEHLDLRQEVVQEKPLVADFKTRWPALFSAREINAEFLRITTMPLEFKFLAVLDQYSDKLMMLFGNKGGAPGKTIKNIMQPISQVIQKVFFNLEGHRLSPKVQTLKNKMLE